jgi:hypothetical protein
MLFERKETIVHQRRPRYSGEEAMKRGREWYRTVIRPKLQPRDKGKYVAIDVETGDYAIDDDSLRATHVLIDRKPDAEVWMERAGYLVVDSFAGRLPEDPEW